MALSKPFSLKKLRKSKKLESFMGKVRVAKKINYAGVESDATISKLFADYVSFGECYYDTLKKELIVKIPSGSYWYVIECRDDLSTFEAS